MLRIGAQVVLPALHTLFEPVQGKADHVSAVRRRLLPKHWNQRFTIGNAPYCVSRIEPGQLYCTLHASHLSRRAFESAAAAAKNGSLPQALPPIRSTQVSALA